MDLGKLQELQHHRVCKECGAEFEATASQSALEQFSDHSVVHNPSAEQWATAHERIQEAKQKKSQKQDQPQF